MAKAIGETTVTVHVVPDLSGFKLSLLSEVMEAESAQEWIALNKRVRIRYKAEVDALLGALYTWDAVLHPVLHPEASWEL